VLAHRFDAPEGSILLLHNLADRAVTIDLDGLDASDQTYEVFADAEYEPVGRRLTGLPLNGWGYRWLRLRRG
jgi:maltose alpha-D-glucosyltransferase/alpha-amylase